jgi:copper homeostasis protein CutC
MQARSMATVQAKAASEALAALGVSQQSQIKVADQDLINNLKKTISALEAKKHPAISAAQAKKKAVNNIQKALTKKILTRLDDTQPLVNVFSKMQSLSKMMPAIQDFEQRIGILHQVEPILENAINTLSKVVDMNSAFPAALMAPKAAAAPPPPPPVAP